MTCDLYSAGFKLRDTSRQLALSVSINGVMWDNRQAFGRGETRHPSLGVSQNGYNVDSSPCSCLMAVWACSKRCVSSCMRSLTHIAGRHFKLTDHSEEGLNQHLIGKKKGVLVFCDCIRVADYRGVAKILQTNITGLGLNRASRDLLRTNKE